MHLFLFILKKNYHISLFFCLFPCRFHLFAEINLACYYQRDSVLLPEKRPFSISKTAFLYQRNGMLLLDNFYAVLDVYSLLLYGIELAT